MKPRRFLIVADSHGSEIDADTEGAVLRFASEFKPQIRIHAGDAWDFRNLRKGASDDEKAESLEADWTMGADFLRRFFDGGTENHFLRGNHDERMWNTAHSATGLVRDYAQDGIKRIEGIMRKARAKMLPYDSRLGVLRLGKLNVVHGYAAGIGAARKHAIVYRNCLFGHVHNTDVAAAESCDGIAEARGIGACCKLDMPYNSHMTGKLRHQNAFCYGLLFDDGTYQLNQAKKINGRFHCASDFRQV